MKSLFLEVSVEISRVCISAWGFTGLKTGSLRSCHSKNKNNTAEKGASLYSWCCQSQFATPSMSCNYSESPQLSRGWSNTGCRPGAVTLLQVADVRSVDQHRWFIGLPKTRYRGESESKRDKFKRRKRRRSFIQPVLRCKAPFHGMF